MRSVQQQQQQQQQQQPHGVDLWHLIALMLAHFTVLLAVGATFVAVRARLFTATPITPLELEQASAAEALPLVAQQAGNTGHAPGGMGDCVTAYSLLNAKA